MKRYGYEGGIPRLPLLPVGDEAKKKIDQLLDNFDAKIAIFNAKTTKTGNRDPTKKQPNSEVAGDQQQGENSSNSKNDNSSEQQQRA